MLTTRSLPKVKNAVSSNIQATDHTINIQFYLRLYAF
jgi:hypothetical protein